MIRHIFIAGLRNLACNWLQSAIAIGSLTIGLTAAIIAGVVTRDAFTRNQHIPDHDRIYWAVIDHTGPRGDLHFVSNPHDLAGYMKQFAGVERVARISASPAALRQGDKRFWEENLAWADPEFFDLYRVPVLSGDPGQALARPDGAVFTRAAARKYFGRDDVVGRTVELNRTQLLTIGAVIEDAPPSSSNKAPVFVSSLSPISTMSHDVGTQGLSRNGGIKLSVSTLVKRAPNAEIEDLNRQGSELIARFVPASMPFRRSMHFERIDRINLSPQLHPENRARLYAMLATTLVILVLSVVNFVNLSLAQSLRRGMEVGIRKSVGAGRMALVAQFLGEALLQVCLALFVAVSLVEFSLPAVNAFLESGAVFDYWSDPALLAGLMAGALLTGALAGLYPALVVSAFRPASLFKGWGRASSGGWLRRVSVALQFAALTVFLVSALVVFLQNRFATSEALRIATERVLLVVMPNSQCRDTLRDRVALLPGVQAAACSSARALQASQSSHLAMPRRGEQMSSLAMVPVGYGLFDLYGLRPLAGRIFHRERGDAVPSNPSADTPVRYVVNETAVRSLGYDNAQAAIGQPIRFFIASQSQPSGKDEPPPILPLSGTIIGVVRDFTFTPNMSGNVSPDGQIPPTVYSVGMAEANLPAPNGVLHIKVNGRDLSQTLAAIDQAWRDSGESEPIVRLSMDEFLRNQTQAVRREGQAFAVFAVIAMLLACLGLFGISLATVQRRVKEIGVRKAMGATSADVLTLLLWQFARPVLLANLIAWPVAYWLMHRWLSGFAYRIDLPFWPFAAATLATLLIALLTVGGQAWVAARQRPVLALRYE